MKLHFWPFLKLQNMEFGQNKFLEIDLFDFMSFLAWTFFNFLAHFALWAIIQKSCNLGKSLKLPKIQFDVKIYLFIWFQEFIWPGLFLIFWPAVIWFTFFSGKLHSNWFVRWSGWRMSFSPIKKCGGFHWSYYRSCANGRNFI